MKFKLENFLTALIILFIVTISALIVYDFFFTESGQREIKSIKSNFVGGLERAATLYSYDGKVLDTWNGKFDIAPEGKDGCRTFDIDGKRNIVCGGIFVVKEK